MAPVRATGRGIKTLFSSFPFCIATENVLLKSFLLLNAGRPAGMITDPTSGP